jgi:hypothetical protein
LMGRVMKEMEKTAGSLERAGPHCKLQHSN